jgi:TRAP-type C4-dicarboxylate transport system permease small subunit
MSEVRESSGFLRSMDGLFDLLARICLIIAGTALVAMTLMFAWLVYGRYVLNDTPTWVEQVSHLLLMVIAFLGASVGVRQDTHLAVVFFRGAVPSKVRTVFVFVTDVLMAGFGGLMFWYGLQLTQFKWKTMIPLIDVSEGFRSLPLTICGALVFLFSTGHLIRLLLGKDERKDSIE